ncbi:hypothetical protein BDZ89DRAFT_1048082 [Hymenopellis radicata]|nr:hypothetical protein BDZ89DRAFT_1048082 [Hymenopellis radicata]
MATTSNNASPSSSSPSLKAKSPEREVIDPVTHLALTIHDNTSSEIPRESLQDTSAQMLRPISSPLSCLPCSMRKYTMTTGAIPSSSASIGSGQRWSLPLLQAPAGPPLSRNEFPTLVVGGAGCCALALVAGASVLQTRFQPPLPPPEHQPIISHRSPETAAWLNAFLASLWPIINPSIFTAVSDMLEDALQASLPKFIHGVRVADIGQGAEPLRILGVRHLKDGAEASKEGDFVNLELAVAYRAQDVGPDNVKGRARNVHLLMEFYASAGVVLPVWVEITGIIATTRVRLQLTPNPPFVAAMTLTFLGQPRVTLECTPLSKGFLNVMDVPGLSKWLQTAVDGAIGAYVAPRSLTLDLKALLSGREKMDTDAVGVVVVTVKSAEGFRNGDEGKVWAGKDKKVGDPYVTVGWGKWGKAMWSTRIIENDAHPVWEETAYLLVTPAETNARERLRLQLWDSDRFTADDMLGSVEVPLADLMSYSDTLNKMAARRDTFTDGLPGTLEWSVGYMTKTTLEHHIADAGDLSEELKKAADVKLREAKTIGGIDRQKDEDLKEMTDEIIAHTPPSAEWPSGVLSVRVEQITGLEVPKVRESGVANDGEEEESSDLPSAYCTIILNDERIYKTRTKMKTNKPYFNAGTERFVKNWLDATVTISVRDLRLHETNPLLGVVVLPLKSLLKEHSQVTDSLPLVGGIGFGKLRFSVLWRSVQTKLPRGVLGWDACTLEIQPRATANFELPPDLATCKLRFELGRGSSEKGKMYPNSLNGGWNAKGDRAVALAMKNRFAECLVVKFRKHSFGPDSTEAWGVFWLRSLCDREETTLEVVIQKRDEDALDRARKNVVEEENVIGRLQMTVKLASGDASMSDVMEVLDCAEEEGAEGVAYDSDSSVSDSSAAPSTKTSSSGSGFKEQFRRKHHGWGSMRRIGRNIEDKKDEFERRMKGRLTHQQMEREVEREA